MLGSGDPRIPHGGRRPAGGAEPDLPQPDPRLSWAYNRAATRTGHRTSPDHRDPELFLANTFGYAQRRALAEHAYQRTRADLRSRRSTLALTLARHGIALNDAVLDDTRRTLVGRKRRLRTRSARALQRLDEVLNDLDAALAGRTA